MQMQALALEQGAATARQLVSPKGRHKASAMMSLAPSPSLEAGGNLLRTLLKQHKVYSPIFYVH